MLVSGGRHSKSRPVPHCMVLPPGESNSIILDPFTVYCGRFMAIAETVSCNVTMIKTPWLWSRHRRSKTIPHCQPPEQN